MFRSGPRLGSRMGGSICGVRGETAAWVGDCIRDQDRVWSGSVGQSLGQGSGK